MSTDSDKAAGESITPADEERVAEVLRQSVQGLRSRQSTGSHEPRSPKR